MQQDLIVDVGMHRGNDTEFYLLKGFRVAGVEANPVLSGQVERRLGEYLDGHRLRVYNVAVADRVGTTTLWINDTNDDWGTTSTEFARRNEASGTRNEPIEVPCRRFSDILDECGTPYYLKIDIEGADLLCLEALSNRECPRYVSIEADLTSFDGLFTQLTILWNLGYRQFKIINQGLNRRLHCPNPPREGRYVDYHFDKDNLCSGLFGEETPGEWISADHLLHEGRRLLREERDFGLNGRYTNSLWGRAYRIGRWLIRNPICWYDIHARTEGQATRTPISVSGAAHSSPSSTHASQPQNEIESAVQRT